MHTKNTHTHTTGHQLLSIMAGWTAPEPAGFSSQDLWEITAAALKSAGVADPRPMPSSRVGGAS